MLRVPDLPPDADTLTAALAYAAAGWYVGPAKRGTKNPGSRLGTDWQGQTSREAEMITSWFAGTDDGVFLHAGRSGAVIFDLDHPELIPAELGGAELECLPPTQSTRPGRRHLIFAQPEGRSIGNQPGELGKGWGEVRGKNGVIMAFPSAHPEGGRYEWQRVGEVPILPAYVADLIPDQGVTEDAATDAELADFLDQHIEESRPEAFEVVCYQVAKQLEAEPRHTVFVSWVTTAMREAAASCYGAKMAADTLESMFHEAEGKGPGRKRTPAEARAEWAGILAWAIAQARAANPEHTLSRVRGKASKLVINSHAPTSAPVEPPAPLIADETIFHGILGELTRTLAPTTEAAPVGIFVSIMAVAGVMIGPGPLVEVGNREHPLLVWPLLFGTTGNGRKGESWSTAQLALPAVDRSSTGDGSSSIDLNPPSLIVSGLSSGEGLIDRIKDVGRAKPDEYAGTTDKRLFVLESEFGTVLARAGREGSSLAGVLRQAWEGGALSVLTKQARIASSSHIGILGHITPAEFRVRMRKGVDLAGGTYNRFLPVYVRRGEPLPHPNRLDPQLIHGLREKLRRAIEPGKGIGLIVQDREAGELWAESLYAEFSAAGEDDRDWSVFSVRAPAYCLRIAGLHAALAGRSVITPADLEAAAALVRYSVTSARYVLGAEFREPRAELIATKLIERPGEWVSRTEVSSWFHRNLEAAELDRLLAEVMGNDEFESMHEKTGGRPRVLYRRKP